MESQAFQKIADDLDKWMVKTSQCLEGQGMVAAQSDLITAQVESFKVSGSTFRYHCLLIGACTFKHANLYT